jgi:hypothetical protein
VKDALIYCGLDTGTLKNNKNDAHINDRLTLVNENERLCEIKVGLENRLKTINMLLRKYNIV